MKKLIMLLAVLTLVFALVACGGGSDDGATEGRMDDDDDDNVPPVDDDDDNDTDDDATDDDNDDDDSGDDDTGDDDTGDDDTSDDDTGDDDDDDDTAPTNFALDFDGIDDYVVVPDSPSLNVTTAMTIETWIYVRSANTSGWNNILSHYYWEDESNNQGWILRLNNGKLRFIVMNDAEVNAQASTEVVYNQWIHVAGTFDGVNITLWIDGFKVDETAFASEIGQPTSNLFIGSSRGPNYFFDGIIDEVRFSSVARYDATFTPEAELTTDANTLGLWHFNEGTGNAANDESANGNHGTLHGPTWVER